MWRIWPWAKKVDEKSVYVWHDEPPLKLGSRGGELGPLRFMKAPQGELLVAFGTRGVAEDFAARAGIPPSTLRTIAEVRNLDPEALRNVRKVLVFTSVAHVRDWQCDKPRFLASIASAIQRLG